MTCLKSEENDMFEIMTQICKKYVKIRDSGYKEEF